MAHAPLYQPRRSGRARPVSLRRRLGLVALAGVPLAVAGSALGFGPRLAEATQMGSNPVQFIDSNVPGIAAVLTGRLLQPPPEPRPSPAATPKPAAPMPSPSHATNPPAASPAPQPAFIEAGPRVLVPVPAKAAPHDQASSAPKPSPAPSHSAPAPASSQPAPAPAPQTANAPQPAPAADIPRDTRLPRQPVVRERAIHVRQIASDARREDPAAEQPVPDRNRAGDRALLREAGKMLRDETRAGRGRG